MKLIFLLKLTYSSLICIRIYYKLNYHFYPVFISINFNFNCKNKNKKKISFIFFIPFNFLYVYIYFIRILSFASNSFRSSILLLTKGYCSNISIKRLQNLSIITFRSSSISRGIKETNCTYTIEFNFLIQSVLEATIDFFARTSRISFVDKERMRVCHWKESLIEGQGRPLETIHPLAISLCPYTNSLIMNASGNRGSKIQERSRGF